MRKLDVHALDATTVNDLTDAQIKKYIDSIVSSADNATIAPLLSTSRYLVTRCQPKLPTPELVSPTTVWTSSSALRVPGRVTSGTRKKAQGETPHQTPLVEGSQAVNGQTRAVQRVSGKDCQGFHHRSHMRGHQLLYIRCR